MGGEFLGTGIIGSILSAPVMNWYWTMTANGDNELLAKASAAQSLFLFYAKILFVPRLSVVRLD